MDAGTLGLLRRRFHALILGGFVALGAVGCAATDPVTRSQLPDDKPAPLPATVSPPVEPTVEPVVAKLAESATPQVRVVAVIGSDTFITDDEVWQLVRQRLIGMYSDPAFVPPDAAGQKLIEKRLFDEELKHLVEREVVLADFLGRLKKNKPQAIEELKAEANARAKRIFADFRKASKSKDEAEFVRDLQKGGLSHKLLMRQLERNAMLTIYLDSYLKDKGKAISTGEVERYFSDHAAEFRSEEKLKWLDLFVSYRRFNTEAEARAFADWLHTQAADPATDFVALVKKHGHGTSPLAGGVGLGSKLAEVQPTELAPAIQALKVGQVSAVIPVEGGLHIVKLAEFKAAELPPFDEKVQAFVRRKLTAIAQDREREKLVEDLQRRTTVKLTVENP